MLARIRLRETDLMTFRDVAAGAAPIAQAEYEWRLQRLRHGMRQAGLDALLAYANKTHPGHVRYLTGYESRLGIHDSSMCLVTAGQCVLLTNASFDRPGEQTWLGDAVVTSDYAGAIAPRLAGARRVGVAGLVALPAPVYLGLMRELPQIELVDGSPLLLRLRAVKSPGEIALLRRAAQITDAGGRVFFEGARPGTTERELLIAVESALKRAGSDEVSFATQVACGPRTEQIVSFARDDLLSEGASVQLDCGATFQGYRGDLSRVVLLGPVPERLRAMFAATCDMYDQCLPLLRPGTLCLDVARRAQAVAAGHGFGEAMYRSPNHDAGFVGHGIGCSYSEPPELSTIEPAVLEENMVIVLEPILAESGLGGVKLEDAVLITSEGPERLSRLPLECRESR
jgi:Xaa-Pro aminopeptidase